MTGQLLLKRSYAPESEQDGARILVDRLWPRGESKIKADLSEWDKQIAPDAELRRLFHQQQISYDDFRQRYLNQLNENPEAEKFALHVRSLLQKGNVTLLYSSKNEQQNNAAVLKEWLLNRIKQSDFQKEDGV